MTYSGLPLNLALRGRVLRPRPPGRYFHGTCGHRAADGNQDGGAEADPSAPSRAAINTPPAGSGFAHLEPVTRERSLLSTSVCCVFPPAPVPTAARRVSRW